MSLVGVVNDFSRQSEVFEPHKFGDTPVHVIGCGATGSWLAIILAKMGVRNLILHDFDVIEEHNIPNQLFPATSQGHKKATELEGLCRLFSGTDPHKHIVGKDEKVNGEKPLRGIVFMLTDTMSSRDVIYKKAIKYAVGVDLLVETRMCMEGGRIYCIDPKNAVQKKEYEKTLYTDEEAEKSVCGVTQSLAPTSAIMAGYAVWQFLKFYNGDPEIDNEVLLDARNNLVIGRKFKEEE